MYTCSINVQIKVRICFAIVAAVNSEDYLYRNESKLYFKLLHEASLSNDNILHDNSCAFLLLCCGQAVHYAFQKLRILDSVRLFHSIICIYIHRYINIVMTASIHWRKYTMLETQRLDGVICLLHSSTLGYCGI